VSLPSTRLWLPLVKWATPIFVVFDFFRYTDYHNHLPPYWNNTDLNSDSFIPPLYRLTCKMEYEPKFLWNLYSFSVRCKRFFIFLNNPFFVLIFKTLISSPLFFYFLYSSNLNPFPFNITFIHEDVVGTICPKSAYVASC